MTAAGDKDNRPRLPFRYLQPTFFAGLLDDPLLFLRIRPLGRSLLFDCGQLQHVAKRTLKSIDAVFISHAHMDHFMGFDQVLRSTLITGRTLDVFGPCGLGERMRHKLAAYDWNLAEDFWCTIRVNEILPEHIVRWEFPGPDSFRCRQLEPIRRSAKEIFHNRFVHVEAEPVDHKIPSLMFRIRERHPFAVDAEKIRQVGLQPGDWLAELKRLFYEQRLAGAELPVPHAGEPSRFTDAAELYRAICRDVTPASIGYLSDVGFTTANTEKISQFLRGVTLLVSECTFLRNEVERARASFHLTTADLNHLLSELSPQFVLPMHVSKTYTSRLFEIYTEISPPAGVRLLTLPTHLPPAPLLADQVPPLQEFRPKLDSDTVSRID